MRFFSEEWTIERIADYLLRNAMRGSLDMVSGSQFEQQMYSDSCTVAHRPSGVIAILTRDEGMHGCGWWKNPDYDRCLHLSLSFRDPVTGEKIERRKGLSELWVEAVFGATKRLIWTEPPCSEHGKRSDVWHYRVFYAPGWAVPILPRGEVYTKEFTEAGWLSWSDFQAKQEMEAQNEQ